MSFCNLLFLISDSIGSLTSAICLQLPRFFSRTHPFNLYDKNMVFEDNIRGLLLKGRDAYMVNLVMLKIKGHIMYGKVDMNILKMTKHPEDGTIRVRWQVLGVSGWRLMLTFWRYGPARVFQHEQHGTCL